MNESAPPDDPSPARPVAKPAGNARTKLWAHLKRFRRPVTAIAAFGAILSGLLGYWSAYQVVEKGVVVPGPSRANASPRGLSLAILPFSTPTKAPAEGRLAEALSTDLTSSLTRSMPWASVASPSVAGAYGGKATDARAIGRELKVRYLLEGIVHASGERLDVRTWLTEASTGTQVWSDTLELNNVLDASDRQGFTIRLTNQVKAALISTEARRVLALPLSELSAEELTLRADAMWERESEPSLKVLDEARSLYTKALQLDPALPAALMSQANVLAEILDRDPRADRDRLLREYDQMSLRLIAVAEREARAWNIRADALQRQFRWDAALEANGVAQKLDPTRFGTMNQYADILNDMGRPEEALAAVDRAFSLQPPVGFAGVLALNRCRAKLALGRYDDAIEAGEKAASTGDLFYRRLSVHMFLTAAYALQGNDGQAKSEKAKLLAQWPGASIARFKASHISDAPAYLQQTEAHLYAGLRKAGIPEQ